jgi:hypothetical protein
MQDGELDNLYLQFLESARRKNLETKFETLYLKYRQRCWSRRECILIAAADLNLPGNH